MKKEGLISKNWERFLRSLPRITVLVVCSLFAWGALVLPIAIRPTTASISQGDVAEQDVQAPYSLTYTSEILTAQAKEDARARVQPVYLATDPAITRSQIEKLRVAQNYISVVRFDSFATIDEKVQDLNAMDGVTLDPDTILNILNLSDSRWQTIQQESLSVLEQVMRRTIRTDSVAEARRSIPTLVNFSLPEDQAEIVAKIVEPFVQANSLFSQDLTEIAQQDAAAAVEPVTRTYVAGETITRRGQIITPAVYEALAAYNLIQTNNRREEILAAGTLVGLMAVFLTIYFYRRRMVLVEDFKALLVLSITFLVFLYGARMIIPNRTVLPYFFPIAGFALTLASLYNLEAGLIFPLVLSILAAYGLPNSLDLTVFYIITGMVGVLFLGKGRRIANFSWAGLAIGVSGSAVILAYRLPDAITDWVGLATLIGTAFLNGFASASLTLLLQFLFSQMLGVTTPLQLMDLLRPDHPLLKQMLSNMPGSYQHSLQVANLAEQAAEAIGADPLLTRAGAIFHDAGKSVNPSYFIENQVQGKLDSHDEVEPSVAAATIIQHIHDGVALCKKYRLPPRILDFVREHHGTLLTRYQYTKAVEAAGGDPSAVNMELFRYPGPTPRSRETALLMLADGMEARSRSELPKNEEELRAIARSVIDYCQKEDQLIQTDLTLRDLNTIAESFVKTLFTTYHPRIRYPELAPKAVVDAGSSLKTTPINPADTQPEAEKP
jgi:putative nucleotidyltransferase with HDIG domain